MRKGFYIICNKTDIFGFLFGIAYIKQEKDFQINILLYNFDISIGYKF